MKLIDFGFTRWAQDSALLDTYCGSSAYAAPEIVAGQRYTGPEADIWSLGVILYTMLVGYLPFDADSEAETHKQIREVNYTIPDFLMQGSRCILTTRLQRFNLEDIQERPVPKNNYGSDFAASLVILCS